nr:ribonuclease H-like domain-containing protein [Tanacetum cinerariifolium]
MESLSPQVVVAAKLPILNLNEFDLWKMRIEQYFLMTDYSLWEVILNGDSPIPTRVVDGVVQPIAPTSAGQRLAKKIELKARGTLLMAFPDKHQLKFNIHKDDKSLMKAIEKRFGGNKETKKVQKTLLKQQYENFTGSKDINLKFLRSLPSEWRTHTLIWQNKADLEDQSLDDLFNNLKIYEAEFKSYSFTSHTTQNIAFVSSQNTDSTNESEMDLKWQMAMLTMRARRFLHRTGRNLRANGTTYIGFDMSKVECYNCYRRGHFSRKCRSPKDTRNKDTQRRNVPVETSTSNALNENVFEEDIKLLKLDVMLRDNALVELRKKFEAAKKERDDYESNVSVPTSPVCDRYKSGEGYHAVPPPYTRTFMPPKPDLVFHDAPTVSETVLTVFNVKPSTTKPTKDMSSSNRPSAPIIKDWVSDSEDESKAENLRKDIPKFRGHRHRWNRKACYVCKSVNHLIKDCDYYEKKMVQKPVRNHAIRVNHQNSARMTHPHSKKHVVPIAVLTEINGGYVAFGGNPKGGKITSKGKIRTGKLDFDDVYFVKELKFNLFSVLQMCDKKNSVLFTDTECIVLSSNFKLADENHVLLSVPRENNMYNVHQKNIVPLGNLTFLFAKATLDEFNLWHRRLGYIISKQ